MLTRSTSGAEVSAVFCKKTKKTATVKSEMILAVRSDSLDMDEAATSCTSRLTAIRWDMSATTSKKEKMFLCVTARASFAFSAGLCGFSFASLVCAYS